MLAGRPPFPEGLTERLLKHVEAEPPDICSSIPPSAWPGADPQENARKKPEDRYQTPTELLGNGQSPGAADQCSRSPRMLAEASGEGRPSRLRPCKKPAAK